MITNIIQTALRTVIINTIWYVPGKSVVINTDTRSANMAQPKRLLAFRQRFLLIGWILFILYLLPDNMSLFAT